MITSCFFFSSCCVFLRIVGYYDNEHKQPTAREQLCLIPFDCSVRFFFFLQFYFALKNEENLENEGEEKEKQSVS
jgi:hypothetical protein